jgi:hypothetical protein
MFVSIAITPSFLQRFVYEFRGGLVGMGVTQRAPPRLDTIGDDGPPAGGGSACKVPAQRVFDDCSERQAVFGREALGLLEDRVTEFQCGLHMGAHIIGNVHPYKWIGSGAATAVCAKLVRIRLRPLYSGAIE